MDFWREVLTGENIKDTECIEADSVRVRIIELLPKWPAPNERNIGPDAPVYFCAEFETTPEQVQLFSGEYTDPYWPNSTLPSFTPAAFTNASSISGGQIYYGYARRIGGLFTFSRNITTLKSKLGVSINSDKARQYIASELPTWSLRPTISSAVSQWNAEVLSKSNDE
jgi:hypothetical protein